MTLKSTNSIVSRGGSVLIKKIRRLRLSCQSSMPIKSAWSAAIANRLYANIEKRLEDGAKRFDKLENMIWAVYPFILVSLVLSRFV